MKESLKAYIIQQLGHEPARLEEVLQAFYPRTVKAKEVLIPIQTQARQCFYVAKGCLKSSIYSPKGEEKTLNLTFEGGWVTALESFLHQKASTECLTAVENSLLLVIDRLPFLKFCQEIPSFEQLYRHLLQDSHNKALERVQSLMALDALERLQWLLEQHPLILSRLSNRLIASYLGISEATLSRLKAKL